MKLGRIAIVVMLLACCGSAAAQQQELGLTIGAKKTSVSSTVPTDTSTSFVFQADYSFRVFHAGVAALYLNFPLAVAPKTDISSLNLLSVRSYSSLFFTPGVKLKLLPLAKASPYLVAGVGFSRRNPSDQLINGQPSNEGVKTDPAVSFGGGLDVKVGHFVSVRGEIRDYNTVAPAFTLTLFENRQNDVLFTGGIVLRF